MSGRMSWRLSRGEEFYLVAGWQTNVSEQSDIAPWGEISWSAEWSAGQVSQVALGADHMKKYSWPILTNTFENCQEIQLMNREWFGTWADQVISLPFFPSAKHLTEKICDAVKTWQQKNKLKINCEIYNWWMAINTVDKLQEIQMINCVKYSWWIVRNTVD